MDESRHTALRSPGTHDGYWLADMTVASLGDAPGVLGRHWSSLDTPALLVDLDRLDANVESMATHARNGGLALRPHFKTHKSVAIARRQLAAGAVGITVAKLDEAEALVDGGIDAPILVAYELVDPRKLERAMRLAARVPVTLAVDSAAGARQVAAAVEVAWEAATGTATISGGTGRRIEVWIEIDSGLRRCGVLASEAADLARIVAGLPALHLTGLFTHAGHSYAAKNADAVAAIAADEARSVLDAAAAIRAIGIPIETVSVGSTPTARFHDGSAGITELRPGNYVYFDAMQVALGSAAERDCALSISTTVISRPTTDRAVIDAGSKTLGLDRGAHSSDLLVDFGSLIGVDGALARLSEEHGTLRIPSDSPLAIGDQIRILPNHSCSVSNLAREAFGLRDGLVRELLTIDAAGGVH
ncbi:MAG: alanine racemase [Chloroflexi bacterium]|nr:alanine racemase [Chloroflexota bacterium]